MPSARAVAAAVARLQAVAELQRRARFRALGCLEAIAAGVAAGVADLRAGGIGQRAHARLAGSALADLPGRAIAVHAAFMAGLILALMQP